MKAISFNLINQLFLFILAMQEWSERRWKETVSPSISDLFAQAKRDMKEGKPLPEVPRETSPKNVRVLRSHTFWNETFLGAMLSILAHLCLYFVYCIVVFYGYNLILHWTITT